MLCPGFLVRPHSSTLRAGLAFCALVSLPACVGADIEEAVDESGESGESGEGEAGPTSGEEGGEASEASSGEAGATTGDGDATTSGDGEATTGDGDGDTASGDGDATTGGDGDGDSTTSGDGDADATTGDGDGDGDATTGDGDGDVDGDADGGTEGAGDACTQFVTLDYDADEAVLSGDWTLVMSSLSPVEGLVIFPAGDAEGSAIFDFEAPCEDNWYVWVRGLDSGTDDSFFVRVDGEPNEPGIFELDCGSQDNEPLYRWAPLNLRGNSGCGLDNPRVLSGGPTSFEIEFTEREGGAISAFSVSNDPFYVPQ